MNRQLEILYKIFELELTPPFKLIRDDDYPHADNIINKHSQQIGWIRFANQSINFEPEKEDSILRKVKQVFNSDKLSNEDIYNIAKHLFNWLQDKFPEDFESIEFWNGNIGDYIDHP